jgi:hypothetical protein
MAKKKKLPFLTHCLDFQFCHHFRVGVIILIKLFDYVNGLDTDLELHLKMEFFDKNLGNPMSVSP